MVRLLRKVEMSRLLWLTDRHVTVKFAIENEKVDLNENQICPISEKFTGLSQVPPPDMNLLPILSRLGNRLLGHSHA